MKNMHKKEKIPEKGRLTIADFCRLVVQTHVCYQYIKTIKGSMI